MTTFYIARHGETENNRAGRLSGWIDTPLTPKGLQPTQRVIAVLRNQPFDAVYASDLGRAFITAYEISRGIGFTAPIYRLAGLREVNYGVAANVLATEAYERFPELDRDTAFAPPDGESLDTMQQRVFTALDLLAQNHSDQTVLLVSHSGVMAAIRSRYLRTDFGGHNISEAYPHDYVARFTYDGAVVDWHVVS